MSEREKNQPPSDNVEEERREQMPEIKYQFYFSPHGSAVDARGLPELFKQADIYIPENAGWKQETLDALRQLSQGDISLDDFKDSQKGMKFTEWLHALTSMIEGSRKKILFADVPQDHEFVEKYKELEQDSKAAIDPKGQSFEEMLQAAKGYYQHLAVLMNQREEYIARQLATNIDEYIKTDEELRKKDIVRVLASLGAKHTAVERSLKAEYFSTEYNLSQPLIQFSFRDEAERRAKNGLGIDDTLAAHSWIEVYVARLLEPAHIQDTHALLRTRRLLTAQFSLEEIREFFERAHTGEKLKPLIEAKLRDKGFAIPASEEEAKALIEQA